MPKHDLEHQASLFQFQSKKARGGFYIVSIQQCVKSSKLPVGVSITV